jgi:hypothetical protein
MCQIYHSNASTNQHVREIIQKSDLANVELANMYSINVRKCFQVEKQGLSRG